VDNRTQTGSRIRERRLLLKKRQSDLALSVGISPAYLNLIEHNRRRIGGKLLVDIAEQLEVEVAVLSEGAQGVLVAALQQAGSDVRSTSEEAVELDRIEEFAGRFPGWAELVTGQYKEIQNLRHAVEVLNDRLSHDPFLSATLHEVISNVSSIRSSSSILVEAKDIEPEWRDRFQRNIHEDSGRLAETSQALVTYLDSGVETLDDQATPQDEVAKFLEQNDYSFDGLNNTPSAGLHSDAARDLARQYIVQASDDVAALPEDALCKALDGTSDPAELADILDIPLPVLFRRLAFRKPRPGDPVFGYVSSDAAGALLLQKPIEGFQLPRLGGGCALWPLFTAMSRPMVPLRATLEQYAHTPKVLEALAISAPEGKPRFDKPPRFVSHMLLYHSGQQDGAKVGVNCRICPATQCESRREMTILSDGF